MSDKQEVSYPEDCIKVLDHGFVRLVDHMGDDSSIVQAARISYGKGTKKVSEDRGLIRYLMRHKHSTPFEMCSFKFHFRMPIFVARQHLRHRTASVNEYSARYSEVPDIFYVPSEDKITTQSTSNRQGGSDDKLDNPRQERDVFQEESRFNFHHYKNRIDKGMRRELARINLPVSAYTEFYWKIDLHNLLHFLQLRMDSHAQYEIRVFAEAVAELIKPLVPITWEAFKDYRLDAITLSGPEVRALRDYFSKIDNHLVECDEEGSQDVSEIVSPLKNKREKGEFRDKVMKIFNVKDKVV